jgi:hypothetical protein
MKKFGSISLSGCLIAVLVMAYTSFAQDKQSGVSSTLREMSVMYEDQFDTHTNKWPEYQNSTSSALIENGEYHIEHNDKESVHVVLHPDGISRGMDSMIQISISDVRGSGNYSYGFVFGARDPSNNYSFQIRNGNVYVIEKMLDGKRKEIASGQIDTIFSNNFGKTLKLVKQRDKIRFYVDDNYVDELPLTNTNFTGDLIGFLVEGRVKISVDWTRTQIKYKG